MLWNNFSVVLEKYKKYNHIFGICFLIIYSILGSLIFVAIESPYEDKLFKYEIEEFNERSTKARFRLSSDLQYFFRRQINVTKLLSSDFAKVLNQYNERMGFISPMKTQKKQWNFFGGLYYAGTLYTTIGYGDIAAKTTAGRVMTIFYSLLGVPLLIIALEGFGNALFRGMQYVWSKYVKFLSKSVRHASTRKISVITSKTGDQFANVLEKYSSRSSKEEPDALLPLEMAICFLVVWILIGAGIFCLFEKWDYFTSIYFFYISLVTIGLGDVTLEPKTAVINFLLIFGGLSVVSVSLKVIQMHIESVFVGIVQSIEQDFKNNLTNERRKSIGTDKPRSSLTNGSSGGETTILLIPDGERRNNINNIGNGELADDGIKRYEKEMTTGQKMWLKLMSNHQKKLLNEKFTERSKMRSKGTQTDIRKTSMLVQTEEYMFKNWMDEMAIESSEEEEEPPAPVGKPGHGPPRPKPLFSSAKKRRKLYIYNAD
uniref:Potassium channel domain-containing protein n=1 Tax=Panagrolaimus sp. PS1159 TaxID=55785 RepID=A0AC35FSZ3_9BILA